MQDKMLQAQAEPFMKLAQANMTLLSQFSTSPEVTSQATQSATQLFQQATESASSLMRSNAFAHLMQGLLKNYTDFLTSFSHTGIDLMTQGQAALAQQSQQAVDGMTAAAEKTGRSLRQAA